ncbi:MAG: acyl-CoA dehydrogenase family protein [Candidatus Hydrogenedentes bacterium]|nr:acyl-CoA dehydrogenase family protein [Candidatus Hydrogenedentota bacterium]
MVQSIYEEEHELFRDSFRKFLEREVIPYHDQWEKDGQVSREVWLKAGEQGYLGLSVPEAYGGLGIDDFRFNNVVGEELARARASGIGFTVHTDIIAPYISRYGSEAQKKNILPKVVSGECILAIAMTEPNTGSDLAGIQTTAKRDGDGYRINGQKTFITNGLLCDLCIVVAKTNPKAKHGAFSLFLVEEGTDGYRHGKKLEKIGLKAQDTAELHFEDVYVPEDGRLGEEGQGFYYLMQQLPQERLSLSVHSIAGAEAAFELTLAYCKERHAFGRPIGKFQNSRFKLAEIKTELTMGRLFVDNATMQLNRGELSSVEAAMVKWWITEMYKRTVDTCLQLHGGYGYMKEYPIAKYFLDCRVDTIYGGTTEIMKEIIGKSLGL